MKPKILWIDLETYSEVDLTSRGLYAYAQDPSSEIMLVQLAVDDGTPRVWDCTRHPRTPPPKVAELLQRAMDGEFVLRAHNAQFERVMMREVWGIDVPPERWWCTSAQAAAHGLPSALGTLSTIFQLGDKGKDMEGRKLIHLFCKPRPKNMALRRATPRTNPREWEAFTEYAVQDIVSMRELAAKLPVWNHRYGETEHQLWCLDQRINDRGFMIDRKLAEQAVALVARVKKRSNKRIAAGTAGIVSSTDQRDLLLRYLLEIEGFQTADLTADTLRRLVDDETLPSSTREVLRARLEASKAAVTKYAAALRVVCDDDRVHGGLVYCGAQRTGRWAGRHLQPHNFARPAYGVDAAYLDKAVASVLAGTADVDYDAPLEVLSNTLRPMIKAAPGKKLIPSDWSNIEGRGLACLAGEKWKLRLFEDYDLGIGPDPYVASYAKSFGIHVDTVTGAQRQMGKVQELALGYAGGAGAFISMAAAYGMDLEALAVAVQEGLAEAGEEYRWQDAEAFVDWIREEKARDLGIPYHVEVACEVLKTGWREAHPKTMELWGKVETAFRRAIATPGKTFRAGPHLQVRRDGAWTRMRLPSGRYLCYMGMHIDKHNSMRFWGVNSYTKRWAKLYTYGGKLTENATQAFARDVMAYHMPRLEWAGYSIVLTVHDEPIAEVPDTLMHTAREMCMIMTTPVPWAPELPLAAGGFETYRYRKE